jgi:sulfur carrier protein ThiS adenylyltransferase
MSATTPTDRFTRQGEVVPREAIASTTPMIAGVGAIGRQVTMQLAAIGCPKLMIYDFDKVDLSNVTTQGYRVRAIGRPKVKAMAEDMRYYLDGEVEVVAHNSEFNLAAIRDVEKPVVFMCVDTMDARKLIGESCEAFEIPLLVDGRMASEYVRTVTVDDGDYQRYYDSLVTDAEAVQGRCTTESTMFAASLAASLMVHEFTRFLRGVPTNKDMLMSLPEGTWTPSL